ncbi:unnamed protein product [Adineta steineri]|uniref:EF-hand domain-containing protein n=1 Tax=Adineta steineri TaxID=433720 RepID=A0A818IS51_9BILA|nr:unnamed protein product [Adineta steineri]CAF0813185.1 unnamed protein product [Adineta steineri]CAF3528976.1 unnamed protein product [Adineta steineri]CAF3772466.1 unnamed protein product [Adineta steineri]
MSQSETPRMILNVQYNDEDDDDDNKSFTPSIISRSSISTTRSGSISTEIGQEQIDHIRDAFAVFDKEMTGSITTEQFSKVLESFGYNVPETELTTFISQLDIDKSGTIEFEEYLSFMLTFIKKNVTTEENLRDAFNLFDQDGDGFINTTDLRDIMTNLGEKITDEDIDEMIREADIDKDFKVNFHEFQRIMSFK